MISLKIGYDLASYRPLLWPKNKNRINQPSLWCRSRTKCGEHWGSMPGNWSPAAQLVIVSVIFRIGRSVAPDCVGDFDLGASFFAAPQN